MTTSCQFLLVALALLVCANPQSAAPQAGQKTTSPQPPATAFTEPEGLLHIDVVVANPAGSPVTGLRPDDFTLLDNGQPAKIVSLHAYNVAAPPHPPVDITLLLDTFQVPRELQTIEHQQLENFLRQNSGQLPQPLSVLILNDSGLWQAGPPSIDGNILADAIAHNRVTRWGRGAWAPGIESPILANRGTIDAFSTAEPPPIAALQALGAFAAAERRQPGRKLLVWFGPAWGVASGNSPRVSTDSPEQKQTLFDHIAWFSTLLRLARVSLCSVSPLDPRPATSGHLEIPPPDFASLALHPATSPLDATIHALNRQTLAIESGGTAPDPTSGDPVHQLNECVRAPSAFYTLTFNPAPAQHVDEVHDLKVNLRAPELTARTTTAYYDQPDYTDAPNPAIRQMTVAQLDQFLLNQQTTPDGDLTRQLSAIQLTERADAAQIASWTAQLHGKKSREELEALADASAFLDLPPAEILPDPPPDRNAEQQMISLANAYLNQTIPHLPNFFAQRTSVEYDETPQFDHGDGHFTNAEPLHLVDTSKTTVLYRKGAEVESKPSRREKSSHWQVVYGTFGPALSAVKGVLADPASLTWSHWEKDPAGGRRAVFHYLVPASASQFRTGGCCLPDGEGTSGFTTLPGYHGEIAIDPATGAILRVEAEANLEGFAPLDRSAVMVSYGPVVIGDRTYICPLRSVSIWRARSVTSRWEWNQGFRDWGPWATKLIEFHFDDYHIFRANIRMLPAGDDPQ